MQLGRFGGLLPCFDFSAQAGAILDSQAVGLHFAVHLTGAPQLHSVAAGNFPFHFSAHNDFACGHVSLHLPVRTNREAAVRECEPSIDEAVNKQIFTSGDFPFDSNSLTDARCRAWRDRQ